VQLPHLQITGTDDPVSLLNILSLFTGKDLRRLNSWLRKARITHFQPRKGRENGGFECDCVVCTSVGPPKPPAQTWRTFLANHAKDIAACDFFTVPTATFRVLYCFVVIRHDSRRVVHFNITEHPTARWTGQQIANAFPFDEAPKYLLLDNDGIYGEEFARRIKSMNIDDIHTAFRSPWQNPYAERMIGSIRRECLDHMIILGEDHLQRILAEYFEYYHIHRDHQGLHGDTPCGRNCEPPDDGSVRSILFLGGLHHRYTRQAA
jgi:putative transposase